MPNLFDLVDDIYLPSTITYNSTNNTLVVYRFTEFYFYYIYPVFFFFAAIQSLVCTILLAQKEMRSSGPIFQYSLVNSIDSTLGTFLAAFLFLVNCGSLCPTSYTFASEFYKIIAVYFLVTSLYFHSSLVQIVISLHLYFTLVQKCKRFTSMPPVKVVVVIYAASCLYGLYFATCFRILAVSPPGPDAPPSFYAHFNSEDKIHGYIAIFMIAASNQLVLVVLVVVNALIFHAVRQAMRKKMKMNPATNSTNNRVTPSSSTPHQQRVAPTSDLVGVNNNNNNNKAKINLAESVAYFYSIRRKQSKLTNVKSYVEAQRNFLIMVIFKDFFFNR